MIDVDRIRLRRLELRLTQAELGKAIQQDQGYISKIERGQVSGMTVAMLERIALALRVNVGTLIKPESTEPLDEQGETVPTEQDLVPA
jgi:transcriptional regulator with XRE-family HTH domain